ncbi:beta-ketoacyl-[acyl-carrier-protein] synthase family protein [Streptomyces melanogenes]|uniref:beta-ketoacyl-[acyl-carrier-protein] synthase family protein n=1 Tax=Streptomyces melanogenes TaxID=67326 RepID=UPI00167CF892|nr:beta-ketoacyl-[acyl-carrier-protein] synthase family protein [Streptomyces melanogenes]GGP84027.1 3-oxoacyl-[acyl-carrier-protein] synthase 2 [Streptomyces melanogenes]
MAAETVVITGAGVRSAFGPGEQRLLDGVFAGRHAFAPVTRFDTSRSRGNVAALYDDGRGQPGQAQVLAECARTALDTAGIRDVSALPVLIGTKGDFQGVHTFWRDTVTGDRPDPAATAQSLAGHVVEELATTLGLGRPRTAFTNACVAAADALAHACRLVRTGRAEAVLCGGAYLVDPEVFAKFDQARALSSDGRVRPFAKGRSGLLLGDGAAVFVVESARRACERGARPLAVVSGWALTNDAHHVVHPHPQGAGLAAAAEAALRMAGADPASVDYVNAHGTGTPLNDPAETKALYRVFGERARTVPVSSTKSMTGHALEAAGALEAVICLLALREGIVPPTAGFTEPDPECDLDCVPEGPRHLDVRRVLSLNAAFGGVNSALVLERP